jgi:BRCA1-associated protein
MCIICGFIGCSPGGPASGHTKEHYEQTKHIYAIEVDSKSVYDFARGSFVHRLLQNMMDGKIIEHNAEGQPEGDNKKMYYGDFGKKIDNITYEYNTLLST